MNWTCPHCDRAQTVVGNRRADRDFLFNIGENKFGLFGIQGMAIGCANPDCQIPTVYVAVKKAKTGEDGYQHAIGEVILARQLIPESSAKPQPDYIPAQIIEDYAEACRIRNLSPKASATLSRRCMQGIIRDFAKITRQTLFAEIEALKELAEKNAAPMGVSMDSIDALHHIRSLGNIGAHMEKDIDTIVPVDPEEAQLLIETIESLFDEWYVARHKRTQRFAALRHTAEQKDAMRKLPPPDQPA